MEEDEQVGRDAIAVERQLLNQEDIQNDNAPPAVRDPAIAIRAQPRARPLLAGVVKPSITVSESDPLGEASFTEDTTSPNCLSPNGTSSPARKADRADRKKTKKITRELEAQARQRASDEAQRFSFTFRFVNYNMAAKNGLSLDDIGAGFVKLRQSRKSEPSAMPGKPRRRSLVSLVLPVRAQSEPMIKVPLSTLLADGLDKAERGEVEEPNLRDSAQSTIGVDPVSPDGSSSLETQSLSSPMASMNSREVSQNLSPAKRKEKKKGTFLETLAPAVFGRIGSNRASERSKKPFDPPPRVLSTSVDCVFGALCETMFPMEDYAKSLDLSGVDRPAHFHHQSAMSRVNAQGFAAGAKGKMIGKMSGDVKSFMLCRSTFEEVEDGVIFCSFDDSSTGVNKGNPMKSFIGETFDAACGAVRFVLLASHFPMQKISSMMEDTSCSKLDNLQKMKVLMARLLQKILRQVLKKGVLNMNTMILVQGDLNSRCIACEGRYNDLLWETLQDPRLQKFMCQDLPPDLQGEWREVVPCPDPGELQATYRFKDQAPSDTAGTSLKMSQVYGASEEDAPADYFAVLEELKAKEILKDWGLYAHKEDQGKGKCKFKPSRLPACTERVLYYAPAMMLDCVKWESPRGYEVNYLQTGSDHKPVILEASLSVGFGTTSPTRSKAKASQDFNDGFGSSQSRPGRRASVVVPDDMDRLLADVDECSEDSDDSTETVYSNPVQSGNFFGRMATGVRRTSWSGRTGMRLSLQGPLEYEK